MNNNRRRLIDVQVMKWTGEVGTREKERKVTEISRNLIRFVNNLNENPVREKEIKTF